MGKTIVNLIQIGIISYIACAVSGESKLRFDNFRVYSFVVENEVQSQHLQKLEAMPNGWEFLEYPILGRKAELLVPPQKVPDARELCKFLKLKCSVKTRNIQQFIDAEQKGHRSNAFTWTRYHNEVEIYTWLDDVLANHSDVLTNITYGKSFQNRTLRAVKLSHKSGNPTVFIESLIHSREWVTVATSTFLLNTLLTSNNSDIVDLAKNVDWVFIPIVNIDGYSYTHSQNRMWRKTRQPHSRLCVGADPNRNFDIDFGGPGTSGNPCSEIYRGPHPNSEPEIQSLVNLIKSFNNASLYIGLHAHGQLLMYPFGYSTKSAWNKENLHRIAAKAKDAIAQRFKTDYRIGSIATTIYPAAGSSVDWAFEAQNISLGYAFEFRDRGKFGFLLPSDQIVPNSLEFIDGLVAIVKEARALNYF